MTAAGGIPESNALAGTGVVVARPGVAADRFTLLLEQLGATVLPFPALRIEPLFGLSVPIGRYDWVIFISANAVRHGIPHLTRDGDFPARRVAAVGAATAAALDRAGRPADLLPERDFSSEGLLHCQPLRQVAGQRVLIVRGRGGRETLARTLRGRGAAVDYFACYERRFVTPDPAPLARWLTTGAPCLVTLTSSQVAEAVWRAMPAARHGWLQRAPLACLSEATAHRARSLGAQGEIEIATDHSDHALVEAVRTLAGRMSRVIEGA
ncbi:MAG: uroporphyrinogen-III synthase [Pseudomonadota bacterium]|nr:uroporphyrinogen-III synthase [Pseudomonadota bacterium]